MSATYRLGDWLVEPSKNRILRDDEVRPIEPRHMRVLVYLLERPSRQIPPTALLQAAYRSKKASEDNLNVAVSHLREALDDNGKRARYIKHEPGKGTTLVAKVVREGQGSSRGKLNVRGRLWKIALVVLLALLVVRQFRDDEEASPIAEAEPFRIEKVSVLPLTNYSDAPNMDSLVAALGQTVRQKVGTLENLEVVSIPVPEDGRPMPIDDLIANLDVDAIVEGGVDLSGDQLIITARIKRLKPDEVLWSQRFEGPVADIVKLRFKLFHELTEALSSGTGTPRATSDSEKIQAEAFEAFVQGQAMMKDGRYGDALVFYEHARTLSPQFAETYLGLALARTRLVSGNPILLRKELPTLEKLLLRAIELDPSLAEAHVSLGTLLFLHAWRFGDAEHHLNQAVALNPNDPNARHWSALFCLGFGRFDEVTEHLDVLKTLAPYTYSKVDAAWMYHMMGEFTRAEKELQAFERTNPDSPVLHSAYVRLYENMGREADAFAHYLALFHHRGYDKASIEAARAQFEAGGLAALNRWLAFEKFEQADVGQYEAPLAVARFCTAANEKRRAFDWLAKALDVKQVPLLWLNVDPKYDNLRSDPRFQEMIVQMGLDYQGETDSDSGQR